MGMLWAIWIYVGASNCKVFVNLPRSAGTVKGCKNGILDLPLNGFSNLTELNLSGNNLTSLPKNVFQGLPKLKIIYLHNNKLTSLPENVFQGLSMLRELWLLRNQLTSLPENVFQGLSALRLLQLHGNKIAMLPENVFQKLSNLTLLALDNNQLTSLPQNVFQGLAELKLLQLQGNMLKLLRARVFRNLPKLVIVDISSNNFSDLPCAVRDMHGLNDLNLADNPFAKVPLPLPPALCNITTLGQGANPNVNAVCRDISQVPCASEEDLAPSTGKWSKLLVVFTVLGFGAVAIIVAFCLIYFATARKRPATAQAAETV